MRQVEQVAPGQRSGADFIRALSLRLATIEPVKVTAPMKTPRKTSTSWTASDSSPRCVSEATSM